MQRDEQNDYFICPHCGAEVRAGADVCRECGASDESGWGEDDHSWDDDFDYDEFISREFPSRSTSKAPRYSRRCLVIVVVLLVCFALLLWQLI